MMTGWRLLVAALVVALGQIGFLGWIIAGRAAILQNGTEILLKTAPVDPRDLLRGDYVRLGYDISNVATNSITDINGRFETGDEAIYVTVKKQADGYWTFQTSSFAEPPKPAAPDEVVVRGSVEQGWNLGKDTSIGVDYGLERFYVPEGEGLEIEKDMRERNFGILAAVADDGTAQIKALMDQGKALYEEPMY